MNEEAAQGVEKPTAGRLLREAREKQGLHIAALAASIKVAPKKLESLESDRFDELPDATFARALAQTVCRALKIDAAPIMRLLPPPSGHRLEQVGEGLNTPFRDRPGLAVQGDWQAFAMNPWAWVVLSILVAAAVVYLLPGRWIDLGAARLRPSASASSVVEPGMPPEQREAAASAPLTSPAPIVTGTAPAATRPEMPPAAAAETAGDTASGPASTDAASTPVASSSSAAASPSAVLQFRSTGPSWIEVTDAQGKTLISRVVGAGETIGLDGTAPFKLKIGNASATRVTLRGQPVALEAFTRDNVARLELH
ncbi:MAG TPA: RodZ domain-containing protein [Caldimonas sp.]|nr:RodZ domain-containing protein [Caldimonas sp.]